MNRLWVGVGLNHWGHSDLEAKKYIYLNASRLFKNISLLYISNLGKKSYWQYLKKSEEIQ